MKAIVNVISLTALVGSLPSNAGICFYELQVEANVFEVSCTADYESPSGTSHCLVTGYFTHPTLKQGYDGVVAELASPKHTTVTRPTQPTILMKIYRNGKPKEVSPPGYWAATQAAQQILLGEKREDLLYFDARSGRQVARPAMECVPYKKVD